MDDDGSYSGILSRPSLSNIQKKCNYVPPKCPTVTETTTTNLSDDQIHYISPVSPLSDRSFPEGVGVLEYKTPSIFRLLRELPPLEAISSTISCVEPLLQRTLCIVKPEAMPYKETILRAVRDAGFQVIRERVVHLTPEQVSEIYNKHYGSPSFPNMVIAMSFGPVLCLCLAAVNAVAKWKNMVGPDRVLRAEWFYRMSMRVRFGLHDRMPDAVHASENINEASMENRYFNPDGILEPLITEEPQVTDYCQLYINPVLTNGLVELLREKPADPIMFLGDWLLTNNPYQPRFPHEIAILPT